ncbi:M15 family metallopeptidase [Mangrovimonas sp. DI 80]|uniref:M15 family metallopeptidase n=1 Tax=Mangrovimonas sp. DI 80 TaxID=1779330 RepID=UPI0009783AAB|nr:M15 family metallopeptidase [Mangrovimonas sp. DI 80]OMP31723.1 D-alanyl-D-alanine carboxypeptidase [Mangrovimonas sp. DI 80]
MKRRHFIKSVSLLGLAFSAFPNNLLASNPISCELLIGKGAPALFGNGYKLLLEAHEAFLEMKAEALKEGINIKVVSSYRDFEHQKRIWNRKYNLFTSQGMPETKAINAITDYSTIPGTSRHHWGTDLDIIDANAVQPKGDVLLEEHFEGQGAFHKLKQWMDANANRFGFFLVYTNNPSRKGFKYEPWHYSYKPLSKQYLESYKNLDLFEILKNEHLAGNDFLTAELLSTYKREHLLDINPELLR